MSTQIATEAQSRKCRLTGGPSYAPPAAQTYSYTPTPAAAFTEAPPANKSDAANARGLEAPAKRPAAPSGSAGSAGEGRTKIAASTSAKPTPTPAPAARPPPRGASLANPNKKARKFEAVEFESDDE
ncbi:hypothetical protein HWV62_30789 [Athelia sp. TMB]|nr:hypothetical protein HWV62_30789 [Athelia sp. TMB]